MITPLWNVRGVDEETRRKAKAAAAYRGMTLGAWVTRAIGIIAEDDLHTKASGGIGPEKIAGGEVESEKVPGVTRHVFMYDVGTPGEIPAVLGEYNDYRTNLPEFLQEAEPEKPKKGRPAKAKGEKKKAAKCAHGVGKGINCWRCGGLAKIEGII